MMSEEALQIAEKRRETKSKREKKRHIHLNPESQRIARRGNKAMEESNRIGKDRDVFKKIRDTKGTNISHKDERNKG